MAKNGQSVKKNMIMNILLTMSSLLFPLITFPYASRILLPEGIGKVNFVSSVINYFAMFAQLGIPMYGIRATAKLRDDKEKLSRTVHELLFVNLVIASIVYVVFVISLILVPRFNQETVLFLIISSTIFLNAIGVDWLYKGLEKYTYITICSIIFKFIALIAMFLLVHEQKDYVVYGLITIFAASASNVLNFINLRKHIYIKSVGGYKPWRHIKQVLVFFSMAIATTVYTNLDNVMLGFMQGDIELGYYTAAVKIKFILMCVVTSTGSVLLPRASYYVDKKMMDEFYAILKKTMHFIVLISIAFTVYFVMYARESILFLSGEEFEGAILPMQVIMPTLFFIGISNVTGIQMLVPLGKEKVVLFSEIAGAITDLVLNIILIPKLGATGAAIGTLAAEGVVMLYQLIAIRNIDEKLFESVTWLKMIMATVFAVVSSYWVKRLELNIFASLVISAICFFGVYGVSMLIMGDKLVKEIVSQILGKIKKKNVQS